MGLFDRLSRYWQRLVADEDDDGNGTQTAEGSDSATDQSSLPATDNRENGRYRGPSHYDYDPDAIECRADILKETGYTPGEFMTHLLAAEGGRLPQQALTEYTDLSPASISRYLQELEAEDVVVRLDVGREKVVFLPEAAPSPSPTDGSSSDEGGHA